MTDNRSVIERAEADEDAPRQPSAKKAIPAVIMAMIAGTIAIEGGYVRNKADPGGETKFGVTKVVAREHGYYGPMRELPKSTAESIYYNDYIVKPGYEPLVSIDAPVVEELFDTTVNMGQYKPSKWFEQSTNELCGTRLAIDGHVRAPDIAAYKACQPRYGAARLCVGMLNALDDKQAAEYRRLVRANPKLRVFLKGWLANRIGNVDRRKCSEGR